MFNRTRTGARSGSRRSGRSPTEWHVFQIQNTSIASGSNISSPLVSPTLVEDMTEPTLVRMRGSWGVRLTAATATGGHVIIAAREIPESVTPTPVTSLIAEGDEDWIMYESYAFATTSGGIDVVGNSALGALGCIDVRAKRRIPEGHQIELIAWQNTGVSVTLSVLIRFLLMQTATKR